MEQIDYDYPDGTIWQDSSSIDDDWLVDTYVKRDGDWVFVSRAKPLIFHAYNKGIEYDQKAIL
jgi:hypothetical protein